MAYESDGKHTRRGRRAAGSAIDELFHGPKMNGHPASTDREVQRSVLARGVQGVRDQGPGPGSWTPENSKK